MGNIILKDKDGVSSVHNNVLHLSVLDDENNKSVFTDMSKLNCYHATYNESTKLYTITGTWFSIKGKGYFACYVENTYVIATNKKLTVGSSYLESELGGV